VRCRRTAPAGRQGLGSVSHLTPRPRRSPQILTLTGTGRLTRDVELRSTHSGDSVATVRVASDRRDRQADPVYVDLILWRGQAEAAAEHLLKGQAVAFSGRFEPRRYTTRDGREGVAYELHDVALKYGVKPRGREPATAVDAETPAGAADADDIPF
jgi:single-strand DNA-binding protein